MIITRYLVKETLKNQIAILFVLLLIFFSQKLIRILSSAVDGDIPANLIFYLLMLGLAEMMQLILPLSLFLAILITFGRLYMDNEMTAFFACGMKRSSLFKSVLLLTFFTSMIALVNNFWLVPKSVAFQQYLLTNARVNLSLAGLTEKQFHKSKDGHSVLYIDEVKNERLEKIFIAQLNPTSKHQRPTIIIANKGNIEQSRNGDQLIYLDDAISYEGTTKLPDFRITEFTNYQAAVEYNDITVNDVDFDVEQTPTSTLWQMRQQANAKTELNWRFALIIVVPLMALIAIPFSIVNTRQSRMINVLPALLLYLAYFIILVSLRAHSSKGRLDPTFWIGLLNICYLGMAVFFNIWDSVGVRKVREKFKNLGLRHV